MEPELQEGDYVLVDLLYRNVRLGDIVVLEHPTTGLNIIKQVGKISKNKVYVIGVNKRHSEDSRIFGYVNKNNIIGKMILKI